MDLVYFTESDEGDGGEDGALVMRIPSVGIRLIRQ